MDKSIFRAYDIRGIIGKTLFPQDAFAIGKAFASYVIVKKGKNPKIAVGYDGRHSSPELKENLIKGIISIGAEALDVGIGPTPMLYFAVRKHELSGGVMITGSHNPPEYNGFKFMCGKEALFGDDIQELGRIIEKGGFLRGDGKSGKLSVFTDFVDVLAAAYAGKKELKIAWDAGNGAAGEVMQALTKKLPGKHILLNEKIDGNFPAHHPDPSEYKNLIQLIYAVKKEKCDIGIAFDGDGDRVGAVDNHGRMILNDHMMMMFAEDVLKTNPGATIIADVKASQSLFDRVEKLGGKPIIWKTGHSFIKQKMVETKAKFAGEMSGHIFFADRYYGYDDGIYAAVRLLNIIADSDKSSSGIIDDLPSAVNTPEMRIEVPEERKFVVIEEVKERLKKSGVRFSDIDGVRVMTADGWWVLRASNTQAALSARCEAKDESALTGIKNELEMQLKLSGITIG